MLTQVVAGRVYDYSHCVGRSAAAGQGCNLPCSVAIGGGDVMYVLSRGQEGIEGKGPLVPNGYGSRVGKFTVGTVAGDEEFVTEFGKYGEGDGQFIWPAGLALDSEENVYVTDEWLNRVSIFDKDGVFLRLWGTSGGGDGEFNRPSGMVIDPNDDLYIVDSLNHRVQKLNKEGRYLAQWGSYGSAEGEFNSPWGITIDGQGYVYVADHKNDRVQKFTPQGDFVAQFGSSQKGKGQLNRPTGVAVDSDGDVYVCDWANNRVQAYASDGKFFCTFIGDAQELSKWARMTVEANTDVMKARRRVRSLEPEWRFSLPMAVAFDEKKSRLLVVDTNRSRIQIYNKLKDYMDPQFNL